MDAPSYTWTSLDEEDSRACFVRHAGRARIDYPSGDTYEGPFSASLRKHGRGVYTWSAAPGAHPWVPAEGYPGEEGWGWRLRLVEATCGVRVCALSVEGPRAGIEPNSIRPHSPPLATPKPRHHSTPPSHTEGTPPPIVRYEGQYVDGRKHGVGKLSMPNGDRYHGAPLE